MVIFDGEKICVQVKKSNYKKLLEIAELDDNYEYISNENIFCFSPTKKIARMIYEVDKSFDESAKIFIQDNSVVKKYLTTEIKDEDFEKLYPFQKEGVMTLLSDDKNYLLADEQGCVSGDSIVRIKENNKGTRDVSIRNLHKLFIKNKGIKIKCLCNGRFDFFPIKNVFNKGNKKTLKIICDDAEIICTPDHLIYTDKGWIEAGNLNINDNIFTNGKEVCPICGSDSDLISYPYSKFYGYCRKCMYKSRNGTKYNESVKIIDKDGYIQLHGKEYRFHPMYNKITCSVPEHHYVYYNETNHIIDTSKEVVHHINGIKTDNRFSNLKLMTIAEHNVLHSDVKKNHLCQYNPDLDYIERNGRKIFFVPKLQKIKKIIDNGICDVWDVAIADDEIHNFVCNKIIVHNCGKTVQGSMYLKLNPDSLPAIIVCPATLKVNWSDEVEKWAGLRTYIIQGKNPEYLSEEFVKKYPVWIINYDILGFEDKKEREIENERKKYCKENGLYYKAKNLDVYGWVDEINRHNFKTIICDEVQYISEPDTLRSRGVQKICKGNSRKIFMSGTPYETRTSQFFTALNILDKKMFPSRWQYLMRYCNPKKTFFGWQFNGLSNGEELHQKISTLMIRRLKKDVLTQLPPKQRIVVPMEVPDNEYKKYKKAEQELDDAIANGEKNALTKLSELKQVCVDCKFNSCISWIDDYIESGNKLVVFVYHTVVFETLMTKYKKIAVGINGSTPNNERQNNVKKFQNDEKIKLFIGNISACCTGLTLTRANAVCFIEFGRSYPQMVQAEDRIHRISQTADSVFAYYLIMKNGIDEIIMETINERSKGINKVMDNMDNSMFDETDDLSKDILKKFKQRGIK